MLPALLAAVRTGASALHANPVRALLATLGVVIGSASLVAVFAVTDGVERYARDSIGRQGFDIVMLRPVTEDMVDGQRFPRATWAALGPVELAALTPALQAGERATLTQRGVTRAMLGRPTRERALVIRGIALTAPDTLGLALLAGRHLTPMESRGEAAVVVINEPLARALLADSGRGPRGAAAALGDSIRLGATWARVVGIAAPDEDDMGPRTRRLVAIAPWTLAAAGIASGTPLGPPLPQLVVHARRAEETQAMRTRLERWLASRDAGWKGRYAVEARTQSQLDEIRKGMLVFRLLMGSFTGITLIVGGIGIMNVLLASVAERTREIGVRKAVGARRRDILMQFLAESVTITAAGSAIGSALGLAGAYGITWVMRTQTQAPVHAATTVQTLLISAASAVVVGMVFGTYPALRAARLSPIDAIHAE